MANPSLKTNKSDIISIESVTIGVTAETLATAGATIPTGTYEIHIYPAAACTWNPPGGSTPTATIGNIVGINEMFVLSNAQKTALIFATGGDQIMLVAYKGKAATVTPAA